MIGCAPWRLLPSTPLNSWKSCAAGVSEAQAKVQAEVLVFALDEVMDQQLATRTDPARLERELKGDMVPMQRDL